MMSKKNAGAMFAQQSSREPRKYRALEKAYDGKRIVEQGEVIELEDGDLYPWFELVEPDEKKKPTTEQG